MWSLLPVQWHFIRRGKWFLSYGEREVRQLTQLIERGTIAVDIGANYGGYTYALTQVLGDKGESYALSPCKRMRNS